MWKVPRIWEGGDAWILGGGPSVPKQFGVPESVIQKVMNGESTPDSYSPYMKFLHNKHVIGINVAYLIGDWIDMVFFGDVSFFLSHQKALAEFKGLKISCHPNVEQYDWVKFLRHDSSHTRGISSNPRMVSWNGNSGSAAISLAVHTGAKRIFLLGFDMKVDTKNKDHWHSLYPKGDDRWPRKKPGKLPFEHHVGRYLMGFPEIAKDARKMGVEIINVCPDSAIEQFPKVALKDVIKEFELQTV